MTGPTMDSSSDEMDSVDENELIDSPVSSPEEKRSTIFNPRYYTTKREQLARRGCSTPSLDYAPPRPPMKSAPPVSRVFSKRALVGPVAVSFRKAPSLESPHYNRTSKSPYFEQLFTNHSKLGQGSFGLVYRVRSKDTGKEFAIKRAHTNFGTQARRNKMLDEVRKYEMLPRHPNIVKFYLAWEENEILHIQLELCAESLNQFAQRDHNIPEDVIWRFFADLLFAVRHLHSHNMIHMDIKPENILMTERLTCKLGDMGLVVHNIQDDTEVDEGDARYLAVEAVNGKPGKSSDIFSLGATILELASDIVMPLEGYLWRALRHGRLPFRQLAHRSRAIQLVIEWMTVRENLLRPTVDQVLEHPEISQRFQKREKMYDFSYQIEPNSKVPPLSELAKKKKKIRARLRARPRPRPIAKADKPVLGAVGGVSGSDEEMLDVSLANELRASDEVDGLIPTCKTVITNALLPQDADKPNDRNAISEPVRRTRSALNPSNLLPSPLRHSKMPRRDWQGAGRMEEDGVEDFVDMEELHRDSRESSPLARPLDGDRICAPRNLMTLFDAAVDDSSDEDDNLINGLLLDKSSSTNTNEHDVEMLSLAAESQSTPIKNGTGRSIDADSQSS